MPNDLDATATYRQVLQIKPNQRAIIVLGFSETERVAEAQLLSAGGFVKKSLNHKVIALAVHHELGRACDASPCATPSV